MDKILPPNVYLKRLYVIKEYNMFVFVYSDGTAYASPMESDFEIEYV